MKVKKIKDLKWQDRYTYIKNIVFDQKDLKQKGAKFQIVTFKPHTAIKPHYHKKTVEIFYVKSGSAILKLNNKKFRCQVDDIYLCERGDLHEIINNTNQNFTVLIFKTNEIEDKDIYWK